MSIGLPDKSSWRSGVGLTRPPGLWRTCPLHFRQRLLQRFIQIRWLFREGVYGSELDSPIWKKYGEWGAFTCFRCASVKLERFLASCLPPEPSDRGRCSYSPNSPHSRSPCESTLHFFSPGDARVTADDSSDIYDAVYLPTARKKPTSFLFLLRRYRYSTVRFWSFYCKRVSLFSRFSLS